MKRLKVFIAAPFAGAGEDLVDALREVKCVASDLIRAGFVPFVPHLSCYIHMVAPLPRAEWLAWARAWVGSCDCVLRLQGPSAGADAEVDLARASGVPVFDSYYELTEFRDSR